MRQLTQHERVHEYGRSAIPDRIRHLTLKIGFEQAQALGLFGANELFDRPEVKFILVKRCGDALLKGIAVGLLVDLLPHGLNEQVSSVGPDEVGDGIQSLDKILRGLEMNAAGLVSTHLMSISCTSLPKSLGTIVVPRQSYTTLLRHLTRARSPDRVLRNLASRRQPWLWSRPGRQDRRGDVGDDPRSRRPQRGQPLYPMQLAPGPLGGTAPATPARWTDTTVRTLSDSNATGCPR